jgi:hypothetical protein
VLSLDVVLLRQHACVVRLHLNLYLFRGQRYSVTDRRSKEPQHTHSVPCRDSHFLFRTACERSKTQHLNPYHDTEVDRIDNMAEQKRPSFVQRLAGKLGLKINLPILLLMFKYVQATSPEGRIYVA